MPSFRFVFVDVFTDTPVAGNQLAVFTDARELPDFSEALLQRPHVRGDCRVAAPMTPLRRTNPSLAAAAVEHDGTVFSREWEAFFALSGRSEGRAPTPRTGRVLTLPLEVNRLERLIEQAPTTGR